MTLDANENGVWMREKEGGGASLIIGNTATNNRYWGFYVQETWGNTSSTTSRETTRWVWIQ